MDNDELFGCTRHDMDNSCVECRNKHQKYHTKINELDAKQYTTEMTTFVAKLTKPDSDWDNCKSKYFFQVTRHKYPDKIWFVSMCVDKLVCQKGQRNINSLSNGIYILWSLPYLNALVKYKWRRRYVWTKKAAKTINSLNSIFVKSELLRMSFLYHRIYNYIIRTTLQHSVAKCRLILLDALDQLHAIDSMARLFPIMLGLPGFAVNDVDESFSFNYDHKLYPEFMSTITIIIALLYADQDCDE